MDFVKEFDTDILDLKIYFKRQKERTNLLYLSVTEYEFLHLRSEFVRAAEDFNALEKRVHARILGLQADRTHRFVD